MITGIVITFFLSMLPIGELRLGIPIGILRYHLDPTVALFIAVLGNFTPVFALFWGLEQIEKKIEHTIRRSMPDFQHDRDAFIKTLMTEPQKIKQHIASRYMLIVFGLYVFLLRKSYRSYNKYQKQIAFTALMLFVAVPLPFTGAWTGTGLAYLFGLKKPFSLMTIFIGIFFAGIIVTATTLGVSLITIPIQS